MAQGQEFIGIKIVAPQAGDAKRNLPLFDHLAVYRHQ
jgi:hypothetical protein